MSLRTLPAIALLAAAVPFPAQAQDNPGPKPTKVENMLPNQQAFLNLNEEQRIQFIKRFQEANRLYSQKRIFESLDELERARQIFEGSPEVYNLQGSCYMEMRAFDKALAAFGRAAELTRQNSSILFNIAEVHFVTKQWQKAHDAFQQVLGMIPQNDLRMGRLVEFKILLCKIKLGQVREAEMMAAKYDYLDDSPYHYYANAAIAYE
ncbi:MAG TPA: hypothetical protein VFY13_09030, partial [Luteolibacter sp.]|nr:hypothetical protein [Luteolibacter sp.]